MLFHPKIRLGCPGRWGDPIEPRSDAPIIFLDRDGVINVDKGYVHSISEFEFTQDGVEAIEWLKNQGAIVAVVTNQSGIGRDYYTEKEFVELSLWLLDQAPIDLILYCPHSPDENCPARKPGISMLEAAQFLLGDNVQSSFLIGDKPSDIAAAEAFGIKGFPFEGGSLLEAVQSAAKSSGTF